MNKASRAELHDYLEPISPLLRDFAAGRISADEFQAEFFPQFADLRGLPSDEVGMTAERFFQSVEDWDADERLREPGAPTTSQLRGLAHELLTLANLDAQASTR